MTRFVEEHVVPHRGRRLRVLDVGSMDVNGSYRQLFDDPAWQYTGLDMAPGNGVDVVLAGPYDWRSVRSHRFDVVVSGQAFEHIAFPWVTMLEVARVLRPGGLACVIVPSGGYEHRYPLDCWRYYPDGIRALAAWADLDVISATTDWHPVGPFPDDSNVWQDTVLIARKPQRARRGTKARVKQEVLRRLTGYQAARRSDALQEG